VIADVNIWLMAPEGSAIAFECLNLDSHPLGSGFSVSGRFGRGVPGFALLTCPMIVNAESWGPAVAIVAKDFPWTPGYGRVITPISDEAACEGGELCDQGSSKDTDIINHAITIANDEGVVVIPIAALDRPACVLADMDDLASSTGGLLPGVVFDMDEGADALDDYDTTVAAYSSQFSPDTNGNGVPDECEGYDCPVDLDGNAVVNVFDLLLLLGAWGPCPGCPEDITEDDVVNVFDLLELLGAWGPCSDQGSGNPPASIQDCLNRYGTNPEKLEACIEAMIHAGTP
jgi:hypothetical protein